MNKYIKQNSVSVIKSKEGDYVIRIYKYKKEGTKRVFFSPELNGKRITATMYARLWEAESLAKKVLLGIKKGTIVIK